VKSFNETHPDLGFANEPVDDHRYLDGRGHELVGGGDVGGAVVGGAVVGFVVGAEVGGVVGTGTPVHATPFTVKAVGAGLLPVHDPLKPNDTVPLVGTEPL
jgi:hypothetical protein